MVLCQPATDPLPAVSVAERIVRRLQEPYWLLGHESSVSASVGVAVMTDQTEMPEVLLQHADIAMYRAKAEGRGRIVLFDAAMQAPAELEIAPVAAPLNSTSSCGTPSR